MSDAPSSRRRFALPAALVLVAAAGGVGWKVIPWGGWVSTDDASIEADISQVAPSVGGRVLRVLAKANEAVAQGQVLVEIDPRDYETKAEQARAALGLAQARRAIAQSNLDVVRHTSDAEVAKAKAEVARAEADIAQAKSEAVAGESEAKWDDLDLTRWEKLKGETESELHIGLARHTSEAAHARLDAAWKKVSAAEAEEAVTQAHVAAAQAAPFQVAAAEAEVRRCDADVEQAKAGVAQAERDLSYTKIAAPWAGRVTRKAVEPGDYVQTGQVLMALVGVDLWVVANFKETQIERMKPGQPARITIDASGRTYDGRVESLQAGSGARFSLFPPENATGNYVKVVQRVPVKIVFDRPPEEGGTTRLGPGMSVEAEVEAR